MISATNHSSFHVYRVGGLLGDDKVIKADDRATILYYLKGSRTSNQWQFGLHAGGQTGIAVCHVSSPCLAQCTTDYAPGHIVITMLSTPRQAQFQLPSKGDRSFKGPDGRTYRWKSNAGLLRNEMQCSDTKGVVVATYRITMMAVSKDGELRINPPGRFMVDFLVATALAMRTPNF
ncbi:hypothetical protein BKA82DRAFT_4131374 [Pisolithus tinctorius]|nr:hypothetical protein BKA82DRAFT_4131374 [Pisolithus tinctorius]